MAMSKIETSTVAVGMIKNTNIVNWPELICYLMLKTLVSSLKELLRLIKSAFLLTAKSVTTSLLITCLHWSFQSWIQSNSTALSQWLYLLAILRKKLRAEKMIKMAAASTQPASYKKLTWTLAAPWTGLLSTKQWKSLLINLRIWFKLTWLFHQNLLAELFHILVWYLSLSMTSLSNFQTFASIPYLLRRKLLRLWLILELNVTSCFKIIGFMMFPLKERL